MSQSDTSKTVLITGCSSGFGKLTAICFLEDGWQVLATTRHPDTLTDLSQKNLRILPFNVALSTDRESIITSVKEHCPNGLDCLVNNAGYGLAGPLEALTEKQIREQFEVNFFAPLLLTRDLLPALRQAKGQVINISSLLGYTGMPMQSLYAASKFALEGLSESLHYELAEHGVRVTVVEPGGFRTGFAGNMDWPSGELPDNPLYRQQFEGYKNFFSRISQKRKRNDPQKLAQTIFRLTSQKSAPLRVRVGEDAQALYYLRRALPQTVADRILRQISQNLLGTK